MMSSGPYSPSVFATVTDVTATDAASNGDNANDNIANDIANKTANGDTVSHSVGICKEPVLC